MKKVAKQSLLQSTNSQVQLSKIYPVACHTDNVGEGTTFVAIEGQYQNGVSYIPLAIKKGATKLVVPLNSFLSIEALNLIHERSIELEEHENPRRRLAELAAQAFDYPAKRLKLIGITGTKGKTTTAFLLEQVLRKNGRRTALLTTIKNKILDFDLPTNLTTRHPDYLHAFFKMCLEYEVECVIMETAAQGFSLDRCHGLEFDAALFTNFDQEHAEFYASMDAYFAAKSQLFYQCKEDAFCVVNADDKWGQKLLSKNLHFFSYSLKDATTHFYFLPKKTNPINLDFNGIAFSIPLLGSFNAYNCAGAFILANKFGLSEKQIIESLQELDFIPGRMQENLLLNGARSIVDYAHNPSSYESVLSTLRVMTDRLIVVFGCGGDRDKIKRPIMGEIAGKYADLVILTSDNPRYEDPLEIIDDIKSGIKNKEANIIIEIDREKAIQKAYAMSQRGSIIAILGKGPDHYQLIKGQKFYFNDAEIIQRFSEKSQLIR